VIVALRPLRRLVWQAEGVATEHYDLIIIGAGSGNSIICPEMDSWRMAMVERSTFGGTCLNRGCIPSKMLIYPADVAELAADSARYGIDTTFNGADWPTIVERVFGRIDPIAEGGRLYRHSLPNVTVYESDSHFIGERTLQVGEETISADRIVIAAGARSFIPDIPGLDTVEFHTSDTILRIAEQPKHLVILGGGFIATEIGHVFGSLGSKVTIINRGERLLKAEDHDVSMRFTELACERFDVHLNARIQRVFGTPNGIGVGLRTSEGDIAVSGDVLLVAVGRRANGDELRAPDGGIEIDAMGNIAVDAYGRTTSPGVWALGDINGRHQLKHMANGEARAVRHSLLNPDSPRLFDDRPAPHAVFTSPQIGAIGMTEDEARMTGLDIAVITQPYGSAAYGWALEDHTSFCKLIGDRATRKLLGAHVIGYQASILVQLLVQGMHLGATVDELANGQVWIHPALSEVVEQALLSLIDAFDDPLVCPTN
jgi:mycothione reductase